VRVCSQRLENALEREELGEERMAVILKMVSIGKKVVGSLETYFNSKLNFTVFR
jgi:hypothetical protein